MEVGLDFGYALAALVSSLATIATVWFKGKIKERKIDQNNKAKVYEAEAPEV